MKKIFTFLLIACSFSSFCQVKISQVYGGGGNQGATYIQDFIEIFNAGLSAVDISNWSIQYASATGPVAPGDWEVTVIAPGNSLIPGSYFLVALGSGGTDGAALPVPDVYNTSINISNTSGKIALVNNSIPLNGTTACSNGAVVDVIGYGATATCSETSFASTNGIDNTQSLLRFSGGCTDYNNNAADFIIYTANPRNHSISTNACLPQTPVLSASPNVITRAVTGTNSDYSIVLWSGIYLTGFPGSIIVTASSGVEISLSGLSGYTNTLEAPFNGANPPPSQIYVRTSSSLPTGVFSGTVTFSGAGAADFVLSVTANVIDMEPTIQTSNIQLSNFTDNGMDINWTNGNGTSRIIVVYQTAVTSPAYPMDGVAYAANNNAASAGTVTPGNFVVYSGSNTGPITVSGLIPGTNYTAVAYEFNGSDGTNNYYTFTSNSDTGTTTGSPSALQQINFFASTGCPLYMASGTDTRLPVFFSARVTGLLPNTTYKYYTQAAVGFDFLTYNTGAGISLLIDYTANPVTYTYASSPSVNAVGGYGKFTTFVDGSFAGFFGFVNTGNSRFTAGNIVIPAIALAVDGTTTIVNRYALDDSIKVLQFATTNGPNDGTFLKGASLAGAGQIVSVWNDETIGSRPLSSTLIENPTIITGAGATAWGTNFITGYDSNAGSWNTIIPNDNPEGVRAIITFPFGSFLADCNADPDGIWPGNIITVNPTGGATMPLQLSVSAAPLNTHDCSLYVPVKLSAFTVQKMKDAVKIFWTTEQEININHFIVQRSTNENIWKDIVTVKGAGNSNTKINYAAIDNNPVAGINYYRLKQVDIDNRFEYSETRAVLFSNSFEISVNPNPSTNNINVYISKNYNLPASIILTDLNGKELKKIFTAESIARINTSMLSPGIYFVKVVSNGEAETKKIILY